MKNSAMLVLVCNYDGYHAQKHAHFEGAVHLYGSEFFSRASSSLKFIAETILRRLFISLIETAAVMIPPKIKPSEKEVITIGPIR